MSRDLYERFIDPDASDKKKLGLQRLFAVLFGALGLVLLTQWDTFSRWRCSSLTPALLAAFLWRRVTPQGGVACIAGGLGSIVGIAALSKLGVNFTATIGGDPFDFASTDYIVIPGVLVSLSLLIVVSLLTPPSPEEKWRPFFRESPEEL